jgi:phage terminase large subunit-like protein
MISLQLSPQARELILANLELIEQLEKRQRENRIKNYKPYQKQLDFHNAGKSFRERMLMAGNQLGKTYSAASEVSYHLTGEYPDWWDGYRYDRPTNWLAGSESGELTKKGIQRLLFGRDIVSGLGQGMIPAKNIVKINSARGVPNLIDSAIIKHKSGGFSTIALKSYEQGRGKWQADTVDGVWFDEEPPLDIYTEGLTRTNTTMGLVILTETPLLGMSDTVMRFIGETKNPQTHTTIMTIEDVDHYTDEQRKAIIASYPAHEREARINGTPMLGSGRIFPIAEELLYDEDVEIPSHWARICGIDFGYDHPFAGVWIAWDRDRDAVHVYDTYRASGESVNLQAPTVRSRGEWIPVAWPHDGLQHDKGSGEQLAEQFRKAGVNMLLERATFEDGTNGVEAGIQEMLMRMETGRFKVSKHLKEWFEEFRMYHRKGGKIVKERDDLLSATRYAIMMLRYAEANKGSWSSKINYTTKWI